MFAKRLFVARRAIRPSYDRFPLNPCVQGSKNDNLKRTSHLHWISFRFHEPCLFVSVAGNRPRLCVRCLTWTCYKVLSEVHTNSN